MVEYVGVLFSEELGESGSDSASSPSSERVEDPEAIEAVVLFCYLPYLFLEVLFEDSALIVSRNRIYSLGKGVGMHTHSWVEERIGSESLVNGLRAHVTEKCPG